MSSTYFFKFLHIFSNFMSSTYRFKAIEVSFPRIKTKIIVNVYTADENQITIISIRSKFVYSAVH